MILYDEASTALSDAAVFWRGKQILPTTMGSQELRNLSTDILEQSVFSAKVENVRYLQKIATICDEVIAGKINQATARWELLQELRAIGYDPAQGFPGDSDPGPPARKGSIRDHSSEARLRLVVETNVRSAYHYARMVAGNTPYNREHYPAWQLVREYARTVERGSEESHTAGWRERWEEAGSYVEWRGASQIRMVALKDSPIWLALGMGAGDYRDALGRPYPPFAFGSGMGWRAVPRAEVVSLGLNPVTRELHNLPRLELAKGITKEDAPVNRQSEIVNPEDGVSIAQWWKELAPDLRAAFEEELRITN